jgi:hypothetical protein
MAPKRKLDELGGVVASSGAYRARVHFLDAARSRNIYGPRRGSEQQALDDLLKIRTAAAAHSSRADGLQAMLLAAERLKEAAATDAGGVDEVDGEHRARVRYADSAGNQRQIKGPRRHDERRAQTDLEALRAASVDKPTRAERLEAMATEAQRLHDETEAGGVVTIDGEHRARVKYADSSGKPREIKGPRRYDERRAQSDLEAMRAAAASEPTRAAHFEAMANEARRLQEHAVFEAEVAVAVGKEQLDRKHMQTDSESEFEQGGIDDAIHDEPFPSYDAYRPPANGGDQRRGA